jgi:hypothetical protein
VPPALAYGAFRARKRKASVYRAYRAQASACGRAAGAQIVRRVGMVDRTVFGRAAARASDSRLATASCIVSPSARHLCAVLLTFLRARQKHPEGNGAASQFPSTGRVNHDEGQVDEHFTADCAAVVGHEADPGSHHLRSGRRRFASRVECRAAGGHDPARAGSRVRRQLRAAEQDRRRLDRVVARRLVGKDTMGQSTASAEVIGTTSDPGGSVHVRWDAVPGAVEYRVYGRSPGTQTIFKVGSGFGSNRTWNPEPEPCTLHLEP